MAESIPSVSEVDAILRLRKQVIRKMEWINRINHKKPKWMEFESHCYMGSVERSDLIFRAHYRPFANLVKGNSIITLPEVLYLSIFIGNNRIFGIDLQQGGVRHKNKIGN